eukprot:SAG31_NODE_611_length_13558_cov_224.959730_19_plen_141_part_00
MYQSTPELARCLAAYLSAYQPVSSGQATLEGKAIGDVKAWDGENGCGVIAPIGGELVDVHVRQADLVVASDESEAQTLVRGMRVAYRLQTNSDGSSQAMDVTNADGSLIGGGSPLIAVGCNQPEKSRDGGIGHSNRYAPY